MIWAALMGFLRRNDERRHHRQNVRPRRNRVSAHLCANRIGGTSLASVWGVRFGVAPLMTCLALMTILSGCPVTDQIDLPSEPNYPPSIVSPPNASDIERGMDQIIRLDVSDPDLGTELVLPVIIRDGNVDQPLEFRIFLDSVTIGRDVRGWIESGVGNVSPTGTIERSLDLRVPLMEQGGLEVTLRQPGCHRVEILVSSAFENVRDVETPGDLGTAVWWVETTDPEGLDTVDMSSCPR